MFNPADSKKRFIEDLMTKMSGGVHSGLKDKYGPKPPPEAPAGGAAGGLGADAAPGDTAPVTAVEIDAKPVDGAEKPFDPKAGLESLPPEILDLIKKALGLDGSAKPGMDGC